MSVRHRTRQITNHCVSQTLHWPTLPIIMSVRQRPRQIAKHCASQHCTGLHRQSSCRSDTALGKSLIIVSVRHCAGLHRQSSCRSNTALGKSLIIVPVKHCTGLHHQPIISQGRVKSNAHKNIFKGIKFKRKYNSINSNI